VKSSLITDRGLWQQNRQIIKLSSLSQIFQGQFYNIS
jgi:hypothetical protein